MNLMGQYEYIFREPWYVATNAPKAAHDNTIYFNLRYTLPGGAPARRSNARNFADSLTEL